MESRTERISRCAIYTRKSTGHGLGREFNSLENQREVCSAYILSQRHKGWQALPTRYDDAAQSGATIERPALQQLMRDVEHGLVDVIVIYKIDRLSRSLADFVKLMTVFERRGVSFVSVTQAFDTSDSMGRMVLNLLLTFAQFEREMLADRVRDKYGAMRRRGQYAGGKPPYGYDVVDGRLLVNPAEADKVREIFARFLELGSFQQLQRALREEGMTTKVWTTRKGIVTGGGPVSSGMIYSLLANPVYIGKVAYAGELHEGQHEAILSPETWEAASELRARHLRSRRLIGSANNLLAGLLFDCHGRRIVLRYETSRGRTFRYYASEEAVWAKRIGLKRVRVAAEELENLVVGAIAGVLTDRPHLRQSLLMLGRHGLEVESLPLRGPYQASLLESLSRDDLRAVLASLVARGEIARDGVRLLLRCAEIERLLAWDGIGRFDSASERWTSHDTVLPLELKANVVRDQRQPVLPLVRREEGAPSLMKPDLVRLVHQARRAQAMLDQERDVPVAELARRFAWKEGMFSRVVRINYLAPDIIAAILDGRQPAGLTRRTLIRMHMPVDWAQQRALLGFPAVIDSLPAARGA